ncbi:MAG: TIGR03085 family protein [Acidimicrobiales bacterium]|nr:MAG: TIGR03085 family protein [Acidimicrobiales bacterium]
MAELSPVRAERHRLADTLLSLGPDAPTLCEGWRTADLAAHLWVRERNPLAGAGMLFGPLAGYTARAMSNALARYGYEELVRRFKPAPPPGIFRLLEDRVNLLEYVVHHEDARRGDGKPAPRDRDELGGLDRLVFQALPRFGRILARPLRGIRVTFRWPGEREATMGGGERSLVVEGEPIELALWLYGRGRAASVEFSGDEEAIRLAKEARLGI